MNDIAIKETKLSNDTICKGNISFNNTLRIEGKFEGKIDSKGTLYVSKTGELNAQIKVNRVVVEGIVKGNIFAEDLVDLKETAKVFGNIKAGKIKMAEGVIFAGKCDVTPS
jgi:cytoskeletal protein CcmA (bactofilin family)